MIRYLALLLPLTALISGCLSPLPRSVRKPDKPQGLKEKNNLLENRTFDGGVSLLWMTVYSGGGAGETKIIDSTMRATTAST